MSKPVELWELSAYVDGDLPRERMAEIDAAAKTDPSLRNHLEQLISDHRALRELAYREGRALGAVPPRLARLGRSLTTALEDGQVPRQGWTFGSAAVATWRQITGLAAAAALGWAAASWAAPHDDPLASFVDEATEVHRVAALAPAFSREASAPVIDSLGKLFAHRLTPPDLTPEGFHLARVDVAATDTGPAAVFFYTDPEARRVSLVLSLDSPILDALGGDDAAPRVTTHDGLAVSYGQRQGVAYALVGSIPEPNARRLATYAARTLSN